MYARITPAAASRSRGVVAKACDGRPPGVARIVTRAAAAACSSPGVRHLLSFASAPHVSNSASLYSGSSRGSARVVRDAVRRTSLQPDRRRQPCPLPYRVRSRAFFTSSPRRDGRCSSQYSQRGRRDGRVEMQGALRRQSQIAYPQSPRLHHQLIRRVQHPPSRRVLSPRLPLAYTSHLPLVPTGCLDVGQKKTWRWADEGFERALGAR